MSEQNEYKQDFPIFSAEKNRGIVYFAEEGREEGREEGFKEGREEGRQEAIRQIVENMVKAGLSAGVIAQAAGLSVSEAESIIDSLK